MPPSFPPFCLWGMFLLRRSYSLSQFTLVGCFPYITVCPSRRFASFCVQDLEALPKSHEGGSFCHYWLVGLVLVLG